MDNADFSKVCGAVLRECGLDYRVTDVGETPLPLADGSFDFVTYMDVLVHHAYSPRRLLLEAGRALARNGYLTITTPNRASCCNRLSLLCRKSVHDSFRTFFEACAGQAVYVGHHREYTRAELRAVLAKTGFRVLQCGATEEGMRPRWPALRRDARHSWLPAVRRHGNCAAAEALGTLWSVLSLPFGRVLWAVGEKV